MARKQNVNFSVHQDLANQFRDATRQYYGRLSMCFSAAMLMFLESDPKVQAEYLKKVLDGEVKDEVDAAVEAVKAEKVKRINARERS